MEQPHDKTDGPVQVVVELGRLQYLNVAAPAPHAERAAPPATTSLSSAAASLPPSLSPGAHPAQKRRWQPGAMLRRIAPQWRTPVVAGVAALAAAAVTGTAVAMLLNRHDPSATALPPPVAEVPPPALEAVAAPYRVPDANSAQILVAPPSADVQTHEPIGAPPLPSLKPASPEAIKAAVAAATQAVPVQSHAPTTKGGNSGGNAKDAKEKSDGDGQDVAHVVDDTTSPGPGRKAVTSTAAPAPAPVPIASHATTMPRLLALTASEAVVTNPGTGLPTSVRVGGVLPNGAKLTSVNAATGVAVTDKGTLKLE